MSKSPVAICLIIFAIFMVLVATNIFSQFNFLLFVGGGVFLLIAIVLIGIKILRGGRSSDKKKSNSANWFSN